MVLIIMGFEVKKKKVVDYRQFHMVHVNTFRIQACDFVN